MGKKTKVKVNLKKLHEWIKALDRKTSIKIGIIGKKAKEIHKGTTLTNAELGAVHEFGATITVTEKMRAYLHSIGIHLKPDTLSIVIPARAFLRKPIFDGEKEIKNVITDRLGTKFRAADLNKEFANELVDETIHLVAETALLQILTAFDENKLIPPTSEMSKSMREYSPDNPTLIDSGELFKSISYEIIDS